LPLLKGDTMNAQTVEPYATTVDDRSSAISWGAIAAGGMAAAALSLVLLALGAGLGFSAVSPWSDLGVSATTFGISTGLYLIVMAMIASTIGGYLAGRLRTKWVGVHTHEAFFRDTAHGFLAWAFATVLSAAILGSAASHLVSGAAGGLGQAAGLAQASQAGGSIITDIFVDRLFRVDPAAGRLPLEPAQRGEITRILATGLLHGGTLAAPDRTYIVQLIAARTGLSQPEADQRFTEVTTAVKADLDKASSAAAHLALWLTASLLLGAFCASLAATEGGQLRDGTLSYGPGFRLQRST